MKKKYISLTRSDLAGGYTIPRELIFNAIDAELDGIEYIESGTSITLEVVEMDEQVYEKLPEFMGW